MVAKVSYAHVDGMTQKKGWFLNQLTVIESALWGRWPYWLSILMNGTVGELPEFAIPQIDYTHLDTGSGPPSPLVEKLSADDSGKRMLEEIGTAADARKTVLGIIERCINLGSNLKDVFDWSLWAFGSDNVNERPPLPEEAQIILYTELNLGRILGHPGDWGAAICNEFIGKRRNCTWFPTPQSIVRMVTEMTFTNEDQRAVSVHDPCVGTGAFLLGASNHSLVLSGQDIDPLMCSACEFAGFLFIPWLVRSGVNTVAELKPVTVSAPDTTTLVPQTLFEF